MIRNFPRLLRERKSPLPSLQVDSSTRCQRRSAFTLIELLIVVTIMASLLALLGGGIRKSVTNAQKRQAATARDAVRTAMLNFWHDIGTPPIEIEKGYYTYVYDWTGRKADKVAKTGVVTNTTTSLADVLEPLTNPSHKLNSIDKTYLSGTDKFMNTSKNKVISRIKIDLMSKDVTVE